MRLDKWKSAETDQLFQAVLSLENKEECYAFFSDLCTVAEIQSIAKRLEIARLLQNGKTYVEISNETCKSTAVIARIKNCLNFGSGGYQLVFNRLQNAASTGTDRISK
jgi:TrpR-related protein YerC/YecD